MGLIVATSCKPREERDTSLPSGYSSTPSGYSSTPTVPSSQCTSTWQNYCNQLQSGEFSIDPLCYTYGCLTPVGSDTSQCDLGLQNFCDYLKNNNMTISEDCYTKGCLAADEETTPGYEYPDKANDPPENCFLPGINPPGVNLPEYRRIGIIGHGSDYNVAWSSKDDARYASTYTTNKQDSIFVTDAKFDVRIVVRPGPRQGAKDSMNNSRCDFDGLPYSKLKFNLGIRDLYSSFNFSNIPFELDVGNCSRVYKLIDYLPRSHSTDSPIVLEISRVETNYPCVMYQPGTSGYDGNYCGSNPYRNLHSNDCFEVELQLSTDETKNLPY